ncbi:MAG: nucleoside kinase [Anaerolineae bacterium]|nr:nucleoside kinase [Anaerolineae bacterium]
MTMAIHTRTITPSRPRETVCMTFADGLVLEGPIGTTIEAFMDAARDEHPELFPAPLIAAIYNARLRELSHVLHQDGTLDPVLLNSTDGGRIYRRSLVLLLTTAFSDLWQETAVNVSYAVPDGGFYCILPNRPAFDPSELERLEAHMRHIVAENSPITKQIVPLEEAVALFEARGDDDKVRLLEQRSRSVLTLYTLRGRSDYYYGYMVPSTGYLRTWRLVEAKNGFILQYPHAASPTQLEPIQPFSKIGAIFTESEDWLRKLGVEDIGRLNRIVRNGHVQELILIAEALHERRIAEIAGEIAQRHEQQGLRLVLIAGPSSSGKTTFSKRLAIQLLAHGLRPFTLELDMYFIDRERTPRDSEGNYDFESLDAINRVLFNEHLVGLIGGDEVVLPRFDFIAGKSVTGRTARLNENQIIIIEGIHGLNPQLVTRIPPEQIHRIYVSALTGLNVDYHNRVSTTDLRLLRRITRDAATRGYSATDTILRWPSVRRGEKRNIFPYQENADVMFNSSLVYELAALRPLVEPLLLQVEVSTPPHIEANRLLSFLRWVQPLTDEQRALIPDTSLLREFIGGSILDAYHPADLG